MDGMLHQAVLDVVEREAVLRATLADEVAARRAAAVGERWVSGLTEELLSALPLAARRRGRHGRWLDTPDRRAERVLVDAQDRPLLHERADGLQQLGLRPVQGLWRYEADRTEEVRFRGPEPRVTWMLHPHGVPAAGAVGAGDDRWAERWTWRHGQLARVDHGSAAPAGWPAAHATEADLDAAGAVERLRTGRGEHEFRDDNRLPEDAWLAALGAALERAGSLVCEHVVWIAARDAPAALRADTAGLSGELAGALATAIRAAAAAQTTVAAPFCVQVSEGGDGVPRLPPVAWLADDAWRRGLVSGSPHDGAALHELWRGVESGDVVVLDLVPHLDRNALRACAELRCAREPSAERNERARAAAVLLETAEGLTARLGEPVGVPGATPDFLPLVLFGDPYANSPLLAAIELAERTLGRERVAAFTASLRSRAPTPGPAVARRALTDRGAMAQLLGEHGLEPHAERLAHQVADTGLLLRLADRPSRGSRLGGPALLPPGAAWPAGGTGAPLSFLAGIDLRELPPGSGRPAAGWWLCFADLGDDAQGPRFVEPERNVTGSPARLLYVPPGQVPEERPHPQALVTQGIVLRHRAVAFEPVLTLPPPGSDRAASLGLDPYETAAYEAALDAQWEALGEPSWPGGQPWVGGHVGGVQGELPPDGSVLLFHLADDDGELGLHFLDGGTIQFHIPAAALARGDYSAVTIEPSSC